MNGSRRPRMVTLTVIVVMHLTGCYTWRTAGLTPRRYITEQRPAAVRLMLSDGQRITLENPEIVGQSVAGVPTARPAESRVAAGANTATPAAVMTPLDLVVGVEERQFSAARTGITIGVVAAAAVATLLAVFSNVTHGTGCSPTGC